MKLTPSGTSLYHPERSTVRAELGDARAFSLDRPESRAPKVAVLRAME